MPKRAFVAGLAAVVVLGAGLRAAGIDSWTGLGPVGAIAAALGLAQAVRRRTPDDVVIAG